MGVTEVGCLAHARRKFFDLHAANKSQIASNALEQIVRVYDIEREIKDFNPDERRRIRQEIKTAAGGLASVDDSEPPEDHRWNGYGQGTGLQPQTLGGR